MIQSLIDSITKLNSSDKIEFNKFEPIAIGLKEYKNNKVPIELLIGYFAYDTNNPCTLKYWIDDSTRNPKNMLTFQATNLDNRLTIDPSSFPKQKGALDTGKHKIHGLIKKNGSIGCLIMK